MQTSRSTCHPHWGPCNTTLTLLLVPSPCLPVWHFFPMPATYTLQQPFLLPIPVMPPLYTHKCPWPSFQTGECSFKTCLAFLPALPHLFCLSLTGTGRQTDKWDGQGLGVVWHCGLGWDLGFLSGFCSSLSLHSSCLPAPSEHCSIPSCQ